MSGRNGGVTAARHLYIHIPFCPAKCEYCAFVTHIGSLKLVDSYLDAICREADLRAEKHDGTPLETVYFGGGTPSLLTTCQVERVLRHISQRFGLAPCCEVTMECHPATVSPQSLQGFRAAGINRVSFGGESLNTRELQALGRKHAAPDVLRAVGTARGAGFASVALDFMYGIPEQTIASWRSTLQGAVASGVDHLSLYPLSLEPRTVFARRHRRNQLDLPGDDLVVEMYALACALLQDAGYEHYEVATWARLGHRCRHNTAYWQNAEFYALGAGAHGYLHPFRTENVPHTKRYIDTMESGVDPILQRELIDTAIRAGETMMLGLRLLIDGPDLDRVAADLGEHPFERFAPVIARLTEDGLLRVTPHSLTLREDAVPLANEVWEHFILG